jgi:hypothetical protein
MEGMHRFGVPQQVTRLYVLARSEKEWPQYRGVGRAYTVSIDVSALHYITMAYKFIFGLQVLSLNVLDQFIFLSRIPYFYHFKSSS